MNHKSSHDSHSYAQLMALSNEGKLFGLDFTIVSINGNASMAVPSTTSIINIPVLKELVNISC